VELFEAIRRDHRRDGLSIRSLADRHGVHRRTVRQALGDAVPPVRKIPVRAAPKLDPAKALIDAMLTVDLTAPGKQRHTARRVLARLVDEHQMSDLTYSAVRDYVAKRRPEIWATAGKTVGEAFVPQTHAPGAEAEVDFADLWIDLAGVRTKCFLFTLRLSLSGKSVHRAYSTQGQEAFLEGHQQAFEVLGGTPADKIRYDNLKSAVLRPNSTRETADFKEQLSAQLRIEASGPEARAAAAAAAEAEERMEAMGRKPGWSLMLNPTPALLADMGVDPVEYKARIARAAGNDPVRRGERDRSAAVRTLMPSQSALHASRSDHTSTVTAPRPNDPPPHIAPTQHGHGPRR